MNRVTFREFYWTFVVDRIACDVKNATERPLTNRNRDRSARIRNRHAALQTFRRRHCDRAHPVVTEMLLHFERQLSRVTTHLVLDFERVINVRQTFRVAKYHVHYGTDDLNNISFIHDFDYEPSAICAVEIS